MRTEKLEEKIGDMILIYWGPGIYDTAVKEKKHSKLFRTIRESLEQLSM